MASMGPFPFLTTLTMVGLDEDEDSLSSATTMVMLRACPNLVECTFQDVHYKNEDDVDLDTVEILVLPHIRHFKFGTETDSNSSGDFILRQLSLPRLQTLSIRSDEVEVAEILKFFRRSSPPLQELIIDDTCPDEMQWTLDEIQDCLSLLPTLTHFGLRQPYLDSDQLYPDDATHHLLAILANSLIRLVLNHPCNHAFSRFLAQF
ncbi:hypothetical protein FB451DRAFT_1252135 [Mycena latifolia]|nr:hypothetical protein FB451DRAFT_1252135 [Mycena latifolia]